MIGNDQGKLGWRVGLPVFEVPDEDCYTVWLEDSCKLFDGSFVIRTPMERLHTHTHNQFKTFIRKIDLLT